MTVLAGLDSLFSPKIVKFKHVFRNKRYIIIGVYISVEQMIDIGKRNMREP